MLQSMIGQIGIFMICAQAILQFRPKETYGKYLRLLLSAMILIQVVEPVAGLLFGESGGKLQKNMEELQIRMEVSMEEAARRAAEVQGQLEQRSMEQVKEKQQEKQQEETGEEQQTAIRIDPVEEIEKIQITGEDTNG